MRLFVGIDLPDAIAAALIGAGPRPAAGIRCVRAADLHLTLHFIGAADRDEVERALAGVHAPSFSLEVAGLGQFRIRGGRRIVWAGVEPVPGLLGLHRRVGAALAGTGFEPEVRAYAPHVTLARIRREADLASIDALVGAGENARFGRFDVAGFILYDTSAPDDDVRYRRLRTYPLTGQSDGLDGG